MPNPPSMLTTGLQLNPPQQLPAVHGAPAIPQLVASFPPPPSGGTPPSTGQQGAPGGTVTPLLSRQEPMHTRARRAHCCALTHSVSACHGQSMGVPHLLTTPQTLPQDTWQH